MWVTTNLSEGRKRRVFPKNLVPRRMGSKKNEKVVHWVRRGAVAYKLLGGNF